MTDAEKELIDLLDRHIHHPILSDIKTVGDLAKALIQRYPQITKKPVKVTFYDNLKYFPMKYCPVIEETIEKEQRQEWIDQHYVEVVDA